MEKEKIQELIFRFNAQQVTADEIKVIEQLLEAGTINLQDLKEVSLLENQVMTLGFPSPTGDLDDRFYHMLALEKKSKTSFSWRSFFSWPELAPKLALASVTLIIGFGIGYVMRPAAATGDENQIEILVSQVDDLKEMMMLSLLQKESATERLKAVSLSQEMDEASAKVTGALLETLNNDDNVNVRLAALDALKPYVRQSHVREELIRSIALQDSPLVQVALAEMMAELQIKSSVKELEKIVQSDKTPADVKTRIKQSIDVLI
jgi:hypothetical protein